MRELPWERGEFRARKDAAGKIVGWDWVRDPRGAVRILKKPENGVPYVIGGDTAGTGSDWFVGQVLDNRTGEQVAVLHHQFGERMYAEPVSYTHLCGGCRITRSTSPAGTWYASRNSRTPPFGTRTSASLMAIRSFGCTRTRFRLEMYFL